jgi:predicted double-glycine peptidase
MLNKDNHITIGHKKKKHFKAMLDGYMFFVKWKCSKNKRKSVAPKTENGIKNGKQDVEKRKSVVDCKNQNVQEATERC